MVASAHHRLIKTIRGGPHLSAVTRAYPQAQNDGGFTLLEILVALAVLGLSLSVVLGVFSVALSRTRDAQQRLDAGNLAEALLLQAETTSADTLQDRAGTTASGFSWRVHVEDFGRADDRSNWPTRAVRVSTTVNWGDHGRTRSLTLGTLRLLPKSGAP